ncbi:MAG: type II toxin-antitoxin system RelE/ParE family toxin [Thermomicrobiales bacterium]|nr:type II toxin-antitoxin system RelE/ParE family toxin [Thermomicrobiales bacterium]
MSSRNVDISEDAESDIRHVLAYTQKVWGPEQRRRYRRQIDGALERLAQFPESGESVDGFGTDLRRTPVGQHSIYYRDSGETIEVLRVLHNRMDASTHITIDP